MDGTFGREGGLNETFRDGWNFTEGKRVERNLKEWMELLGRKKGGT